MNGLTVCLVLLISTMPGILGQCPMIQPPQGGTMRERILQDNTLQIIFFCEPKLRLKGHKVMTCTFDGWDHLVPKCVPREHCRIRGDFPGICDRHWV